MGDHAIFIHPQSVIDYAYRLVKEYEEWDREQEKIEDPLLKTWHGMRSRCNNPNNPGYKHYGGRGISVCERWNKSYTNFKKDMSPRPDGMTLDRIDVNGNYEPDNCQWATAKQQRNNRRDSQSNADTINNQTLSD